MRRLRYTEQADRDLDALLAETADKWPASIARTIQRLRRFEQVVAEFPESGQRTRYNGIRRYTLRPLPYVAFYRVTKSEVVILRIYGALRRPLA